MPQNPCWTKFENTVLKNLYAQSPEEEILAQLPGRNWRAVQNRAKRLALTRIRQALWTEKKLTLLKEIYANNSKEFILSKINNSWSNILKTAQNLGLKRDSEILKKEYLESCRKNGKRNFFSKEEDDTLTEFYSNSTDEFLKEKFPGRTLHSLRSRASDLGLTRNTLYKRRDATEESIFRQIYPNGSKKEILEKIHRPWPQIRVIARSMGLHRNPEAILSDRKIRYKVRKNAWQEKEIQLLKDIYEHNTKKFIMEEFKKRDFARSWQSLFVTAKELGLIRDPELILKEMIEGGKNAPARQDFWSEKENNVLRKIYSSNLQANIEQKLPDRTWKAIRGQTVNLGLTRDKDKIVQDQDIKYKKTVYKKYGTDCTLKVPEIKAKSQQTNLERRGVPYALLSPIVRAKINATIKEKYGVENLFQSKEIQNKIRESFYKQGTQRCSSQQTYLANLLKGKLNYPVGNCNVDILLDHKIICEYDGGGHRLCVKLHTVSSEEFNKTERKRELFLKSQGYSIIKIISENDLLPQDEVLFKMVQEGKNYLKEGHSWVTFNIDTQEIVCSKLIAKYDFGKLRKIKKSLKNRFKS